MKFEVTLNNPDKVSADTLIVFAYATDAKNKKTYIPLNSFAKVDALMDGQLSHFAEIERFSAKRGEIIKLLSPKHIAATQIVVIGLGKKDDFIADDLRRSVGIFAKAMKRKIDSTAIIIPDEYEGIDDTEFIAQVIAEGLLLGTYHFAKYKSKDAKDRVFASAIFLCNNQEQMQKTKRAVTKAELYADATYLARDLINEQPFIATPTYLAKLATDIAKSSPQITCKIIDKAEAEKLGMEAFLGIARASDTPPKFIHLEYTPVGKQTRRKKLAIVGKGITFDSGGINVKPGDHMQTMKLDMSGAAVVLGVFSVIAKIKPKFSVVGLVAATSNMISGSAIVPGDVVRALNGKTIEILNTDAEGRVTLADSLSYAVKLKATEIIDFATLTGACMVALGNDISGLMSNNHDLATRVKTAAFASGEKVWELPLERDYKAMNKSEVADIANIPNSRYGGTITAGLFLEEFVADTPWVHLDIAGPAFAEHAVDIGPKGGTGCGVRMILNLLSE